MCACVRAHFLACVRACVRACLLVCVVLLINALLKTYTRHRSSEGRLSLSLQRSDTDLYERSLLFTRVSPRIQEAPPATLYEYMSQRLKYASLSARHVYHGTADSGDVGVGDLDICLVDTISLLTVTLCLPVLRTWRSHCVTSSSPTLDNI